MKEDWNGGITMVFSYSSLEMIVKEKLLWEEGMGWNEYKGIVKKYSIPFPHNWEEHSLHSWNGGEISIPQFYTYPEKRQI